MKKNIFEALDLIDTQEEFAVFRHGCSHLDVEPKAHKIVETAKELNVNKVVLVGGCGDALKKDEDTCREIIEKASIEVARIDPEGLGIWCIQQYLDPNFALNIKTWTEALSWQTCLNHLVAAARNIQEVQEWIELEESLLKGYPVVQKVQSFELHLPSHPNASFMGNLNRLLSIPQELASSDRLVALFNPDEKTGVFVAEYPQSLLFNIVHSEIDLRETLERGYEIGQGSLRIISSNSTSSHPCCIEFSLYTYRGKWEIEKHPELDLKNPPIKYIPMWKRIQQA
ncbi:hypothetical protein CL633_01060 [bacterium]|nr:hypothetical protein [bacterium]|tara:strand:- start:1817 stop:2668 length:852 start_codon:yes stop_codon:yes gene_type:complete